jgi:hypothetical protein
MHRCAAHVPPCGTTRRLFLQAAGAAGLMAALPGVFAQMARRFPRNALRGEIVFTDYPEIKLNGQATRLSPGARVRDTTNMNALPSALAGSRSVVNYRMDSMGLVNEVWILTRDEIAKLWPRTAQEAATWAFDDASQVWSKP